MPEEWVRKSITAAFLSDAHLGSGSGGGGIDALFTRDRHGRPVIWASHIEGVLRDAARRLGLNEETFFGRAGGELQRAIFTSLYSNQSYKSHIWRSTASEAFDNRAPKDDTLRVIEYVPKGAEFVGEIELPKSQLETLQRLMQEVDGLGGGRSTGAGRVKLIMSDPAIVNPQSEGPKPQSGGPTKRIRLLLKNRDPLCITATATPDNLIPSLSFVPGRTLLGSIAGWLIAEDNCKTASLLTSGKVLVSDALPLPHKPFNLLGLEVLPAPLSLQSEKPKGAAGNLPWWAQSIEPTKRLDMWNTKQKLKRPEDDLFVCRFNAQTEWTAFRPSCRVRLRNGKPDPRSADASLFAIEQIVEETHFLAELHGSIDDMNQLAKNLAPVLEGRRWLRVGRGGAPVEVVQLAWSGDATDATPTTHEKAVLTLTSDLLVRDEHLRWRTMLDKDAFMDLLGPDPDIDLDKSLQDSVTIQGFNGTSRLWRMPAAAIRRGSVFEVSGKGVAKLAKRAGENKWLGERTHEGFGRFRIDTTLPGVTGAGLGGNANLPTTDQSDETIAKKTKNWFDDHKALANSFGDNERKPSLSQWLDLVGDLEANNHSAITSRLNPTTVGGSSWKHKDAVAILNKLRGIDDAQQKLYARLFVRWLRVKMRTMNTRGA
jgi:hypothetical protein